MVVSCGSGDGVIGVTGNDEMGGEGGLDGVGSTQSVSDGFEWAEGGESGCDFRCPCFRFRAVVPLISDTTVDESGDA